MSNTTNNLINDERKILPMSNTTNNSINDKRKILPMSNITNTTNSSIKQEAREKKYDIHKRIYDFIIRVIKLCNKLPKTQANQVIVGQLLRCVTSMGANDQEADGSLTKKDFVHCYTTVRKEGKETNFWLSLISDTNLVLKDETLELLGEGKEIVAIVSSIINKTKS